MRYVRTVIEKYVNKTNTITNLSTAEKSTVDMLTILKHAHLKSTCIGSPLGVGGGVDRYSYGFPCDSIDDLLIIGICRGECGKPSPKLS